MITLHREVFFSYSTSLFIFNCKNVYEDRAMNSEQISKILRDAAFTYRPIDLSCSVKSDLYVEMLPPEQSLEKVLLQCSSVPREI